MAVQWGTFPVEFVSGIDTKSDPKAVGASSPQTDKTMRARMLAMKNTLFTRPGSIRKANTLVQQSMVVRSSSIVPTGLDTLGPLGALPDTTAFSENRGT